MTTLEIAELTNLVRHIDKFLKPRIPIYNSEALDKACSKIRRSKKQAIAKRIVIHSSSIRKLLIFIISLASNLSVILKN